MSTKSYIISIRSFLVLCLWCAILQTISTAVHAEAFGEEGVRASSPLVKREERRTLVSTEDGEISAVRVADNINGSYLLHFFTLEPNSLFLPAVLHADMVFYVHTGSGKLSWTEEDDLKSTELKRGDVYSVEQGAVFFLHSNLETETERQKLRIHAIFANSKNDLHEPATGPYSSIRDMVLGFDRQVLQAAFKVPEEVIDELLNGTNAAAIVHGLPRSNGASAFEMETQFVRSLLGKSTSYNIFELNKKKKKKKSSEKLFNLFKDDKDFENCNGWSTAVTGKKLSALKGSDVGLFMVNLTAGSMMGPHWNPMATEIAVVLQGRGMIRVVCSSISNETRCRNMRFEVEEGDVFAVPRFHPMAQISFNNGTLVFMGFSTSAKMNHPQFLAGQASVFRSLDKDVLAMSFNVTNTILDQLLAPQHDSVILGCVSCAEEELRIMEEEIEREREKAREREEEETRRREEEEARKREEEAARREKEGRRRREEEQEAARKREEELEAARREEEGRRRREEEQEAARKREEEERRREEKEARQREEEERREKEERRREEEQEEEAARQREEKEARQKEKEAEAARKEQGERIRREEEEREREEHEEARRRHHEQEEQRGRSEEERAAEEERRREEQAQREEAAAGQQEREREQGGESEGENRGDKGWGRIMKKRLTL